MKVFFAVDGSPHSLAAVRQVGQLLSSAADRVALYFAPPEIALRHADPQMQDDMMRRARQAIADAVFGEARAQLPDALSASAAAIVAEHTPREGILLESEKWGADLIVVGARGLGPIDRLLLGNVSHAVAQTAKVPVYVARPNPEHRRGQPLRVLFTFDGSEGASAALQTAEKFAFPAGTQVIAVAVIEGMAVAEMPDWIMKKARDADTEAMSQAWVREHEDDKRQARDQLAAFMAKQPAPFDKAEVVVAEGHAADEVLKLVHQREIDLIIVGSHGKGMLERMFLGSTSDSLLNHAACSVLLGRAKK